MYDCGTEHCVFPGMAVTPPPMEAMKEGNLNVLMDLMYLFLMDLSSFSPPAFPLSFFLFVFLSFDAQAF